MGRTRFSVRTEVRFVPKTEEDQSGRRGGSDQFPANPAEDTGKRPDAENVATNETGLDLD